MPKVIDNVIEYIKKLQDKGYSVEYKQPENPELVLVHTIPNRPGIVMIEAKLEILTKLRVAIEHN